MAKFVAYYGNNSNGPEKKIGHTWITGTGFSKILKNNNKSIYKVQGTYKNKTYQLNHVGKNFKYDKNGYVISGTTKSFFLYEENKLKQKWENININIVHYINLLSDSGDGNGPNLSLLLNKFNNYVKTYFFGGNDIVSGNKGKDNLWGYLGNDKISGGSGNDILNGGNGDDLLVGGEGKDKLIGGKGKDIFKLSNGYGYDLIQDFKNNQDKIFIGSIKKLRLKNRGKDVCIYNGKDLLAKVKGSKGDLSKKGNYLV